MFNHLFLFRLASGVCICYFRFNSPLTSETECLRNRGAAFALFKLQEGYPAQVARFAAWPFVFQR